MSSVLNFCKLRRRTIILIFCCLLPFILSPMLFSPHKEFHCAYVIILMAIFYVLEPVPITVTGFLPVIMFPVLGIMSSTEICPYYIKEMMMMFIGGLIMAVAIEHCMLHERIALKTLLLIGTEMHRLLLGFMLTTMFLSMWMSNTGTTAVMVPIVESVTQEMFRSFENCEEMNMVEVNKIWCAVDESNHVQGKTEEEKPSKETLNDRKQLLRTTLLLGVCYAANIGGTSVITATGPNLILMSLIEENFPGCDQITFSTWMMYNVPGMLLCILLGYFYLYIVCIKFSKITPIKSSNDDVRNIIQKKYQSLGPMRFHQVSVLVLFIALVLLWVFRDPKFIDGWAAHIGADTKIGDSVAAIGIAFLLFLIPSNPFHFDTSPALLDWRTAERRVPWGILILIGGGLSLAQAAKKTGLSTQIGQMLIPLSQLPSVAFVGVICVFTCFMTEIMTNGSIASMLLPIVGDLAVSTQVHPLFLMLPVTVCCSYAFMLPVATPPNAIAYESGNMKIIDMVKPGLAMNFICCSVQLLMINTLGVAMFNLNEFPSWAKTPANTFSSRYNFSTSTDILMADFNETIGLVTGFS